MKALPPSPANVVPPRWSTWRASGMSHRPRWRSRSHSTTSVLFGATSPEQVRENVDSLKVYDSLDQDQLARLEELAASD
jgi:predicted aldo/keto reductase-like oxidoreductase